MDNIEYIDNYFKSSPTNEQKHEFEQRIINDMSFAEEVSFYIAANSAMQEQLQQEKKSRFRKLYEHQKVAPVIKRPVIKMVRYIAAASVVVAAILLTWLLSGKNNSPQQLAGHYITKNFQKLDVTMGNQDSLQLGLRLYNERKFPQALNQFEAILKNDPANNEAKKYAGIASLRMENYNRALACFSMLASDTTLFSNPGKFYKAVSLLKRNQAGDEDTAKKLLLEVIDKDLEGKEEAIEWLKKF